jgi:hypothetical protein
MSLCPTCNGRKVVAERFTWELCPACGGTGQIPDASEKAPDVAEAAIEAECTKILEEDGWRALRTDPVSDRGRGKGFGEVGMADAQFSRPATSEVARKAGWCQLLYVEFKTGRNRARAHQIKWHRDERARGFLTWIANEDFPATVDGFREYYASSGLMRRDKWW